MESEHRKPTPRQLEVLELLGDVSPAAAASSLGVAPTTIRTHVHEIRRRLGVPSTAAALMKCIRAGWLDAGGGRT